MATLIGLFQLEALKKSKKKYLKKGTSCIVQRRITVSFLGVGAERKKASHMVWPAPSCRFRVTIVMVLHCVQTCPKC